MRPRSRTFHEETHQILQEESKKRAASRSSLLRASVRALRDGKAMRKLVKCVVYDAQAPEPIKSY
jgi:hypothetical protein